MNVAFIPVRGGSKSIPLKNIKMINGRPLVYWTVKAACGCKYIDKVYVATDSDIIKNTVNEFTAKDRFFDKAVVIDRSAQSASDTASTELAMLEFAEKHHFDNIALIQATSPLLTKDDLNRGFEVFNQNDTDSVLSCVMQKRFYWSADKNGIASPSNYDVYNRPRRQDFDGCYVENGAFYITSRADLIRTKNRVSGNIKIVEMNEDSFFEIDEPSDWVIIEALMKRKSADENGLFTNIRLFLTDCDGCLTDGGMYYSENGDELKKFNTRDGMGFSLLREKGIRTGIITSECVELNKRRAEKLRLDILQDGCGDKAEAIRQLCASYDIPLSEVLYIGDDINDINAFEIVGYSCCPADACDEVKRIVKYVARAKGGEGVIREIADMLLKRGTGNE